MPSIFGSEERTENLFEISWSIPSAVPHRDQHLIGFVRTGKDNRLSRSIIHRGHRFDSVHHEIENDLLQLHAVSENRRETGGLFPPEPRLVARPQSASIGQPLQS